MFNALRIALMAAIRTLARTFYRFETHWIGASAHDRWDDVRLVAILNHTSLFEWLFAGAVSQHALSQIATRGLVPAADKTIRRPFVGRFLKSLAPHFVSITREPDHTWDAVLGRVEAKSLVVILPEGRMMRRNGLDKHGKPMTVRGGIADLLRAIPSGRMILAYSGGLHHVQVPGERLPRLFKTIGVTFEVLDIEAYKSAVGDDDRPRSFKREVKNDLERRRDHYCPVAGRDPATLRRVAASSG